MPRYRKRVESDEPNLTLRYEIKTRSLTKQELWFHVRSPEDRGCGC
jgi:hypothetical protein